MSAAQYARLVPKKYRSRTLPKIDRPWRPRIVAWAGPAAFYPNRFYEIDKWYKARIDKPQKVQKMHIIDPAEHSRSLDELLANKGVEEINIGFKVMKVSEAREKSVDEKKNLERISRHMELLINVDETKNPNLGVYKHFKIFEHLFGEATFFHTVQQLDVSFGEDVVFSGNVIEAANTSAPPSVVIESLGNAFNTLMMVNLDGNPYEKKGEMIHWLVTNIPDGQPVHKGAEVMKYLQPLPFYGTGYHRVALILFRHDEPISLTPNLNDEKLEDRAHEIAKIYKENEKVLTPSGIKFFQTSYDDSVKQTLHSLGLKSPLYSYEYNEALKPDQREFPERPQPFNLYLDMYRDPKEIEEEVVEKRLETAQLEQVQVSKWRDPNYVENKKTLPAWQHEKIYSREGRHKAYIRNPIDS
ncbi:unnamed protein product [Caenorhabditis auriculariae]|uniref:Large ribosomal subunit protein mL38 n=1 Tax=Caenorhabditis auriculariae TaxID=2777116 RepID=A0A8S1GNK7_9PELO|nr:unnamed protein product [Caenorhabditis auriculariae]